MDKKAPLPLATVRQLLKLRPSPGTRHPEEEDVVSNSGKNPELTTCVCRPVWNSDYDDDASRRQFLCRETFRARVDGFRDRGYKRSPSEAGDIRGI
jgi:hypothetical protein